MESPQNLQKRPRELSPEQQQENDARTMNWKRVKMAQRRKSRQSLIVAISQYDKLDCLPGAAVDEEKALRCCDDLGFETVSVKGRVTLEALEERVEEFLEKVKAAAEQHTNPVALVFIACHGMQLNAEDRMPRLLMSDSCIHGNGYLASPGFDVESNLVKGLNSIHPRAPGILSSILVLDCCREHRHCYTFRSTSAQPMEARKCLKSLSNDFYFVFACDPGRGAPETAGGGGLLTQEVVSLLPYAAPIKEVLDEAAWRAEGPYHRPWVMYRSGRTPLILGNSLRPGPLSTLPTSSFAFASATSTNFTRCTGDSGDWLEFVQACFSILVLGAMLVMEEQTEMFPLYATFYGLYALAWLVRQLLRPVCLLLRSFLWKAKIRVAEQSRNEAGRTGVSGWLEIVKPVSKWFSLIVLLNIITVYEDKVALLHYSLPWLVCLFFPPPLPLGIEKVVIGFVTMYITGATGTAHCRQSFFRVLAT